MESDLLQEWESTVELLFHLNEGGKGLPKWIGTDDPLLLGLISLQYFRSCFDGDCCYVKLKLFSQICLFYQNINSVKLILFTI